MNIPADAPCLMQACPYADSCRGEERWCYKHPTPIVELTEVVTVNFKHFGPLQSEDEDLMPVDLFLHLNSDRIV